MTNIQSWQRIEKITLGAAGVIDFQNIPSTYDHLRIFVEGVSSFAGNQSSTFGGRFNADAGQSYRSNLNFINTSGLLNSGVDNTAPTYDLYLMLFGALPQGNATTQRGSMEISIPYYKVAGVNRQVIVRDGVSYGVDGATVTNLNFFSGSQWSSTVVINRIQLGGYVASGAALFNLKAGSTASLWGLHDP